MHLCMALQRRTKHTGGRRAKYLGDIIVVSAELFQCQPGLIGRDCPNMLGMRPPLAVAKLKEHLILALHPWQQYSYHQGL